MRKVIAAINMTLDGICDHTAGIIDEDIHRHYTELLEQGGVILYGRTTYNLMEYWRMILEKPSDEQTMNDFALAIDKIPKTVFSQTLKKVDWKSATVAKLDLKEEVLGLKKQTGKPIYVGSRSLIMQLLKLNLIDEFQLCMYPVLAGTGLPLFDGSYDRTILKLVKTKTFDGGAVILYYQPRKED